MAGRWERLQEKHPLALHACGTHILLEVIELDLEARRKTPLRSVEHNRRMAIIAFPVMILCSLSVWRGTCERNVQLMLVVWQQHESGRDARKHLSQESPDKCTAESVINTTCDADALTVLRALSRTQPRLQ